MEKSVPEPYLEKQLKGHQNGITALHYSPNEQQIASSSLDNSVLLWDLCSSIRSYRFKGHREAVTDVTFSPTGKYMASASRDKTVRLWVPTVTGSTGMFKAHSQTVRSVQFSPDASKILTASDDKMVKLWATDKYKFLASFKGHTNWVRCARMSNDGSVIASCSDDKTIRLWNPSSGECIHTYKEQKGHGLHLAWHPTGCYIAVATVQGNVKLFDIRTHSLVQYYSIHSGAVNQVAFHPSGSYILTASKDGNMKILDLLEGHPIFTLSGHSGDSGAVNAVNFSSSGDTFASAGDDKLVFIWKTNFTELQSDVNENVPQNAASVPRTASQSSKMSSAKVSNVWNHCYHSTSYPVRTFVHLDNIAEASEPASSFREPNANSTLLNPPSHSTSMNTSIIDSMPKSSPPTVITHREAEITDVGDISHIPRAPPAPATYTLPSILNKSMGVQDQQDEGLFGMIQLKENDVCYTSGRIEWVGKKRSFPINSGFKILAENATEPTFKRMRPNKNFASLGDKVKDCECADMLPTVNAIVEHLNALHEAVDLVDLRLNTLEDAMSGNES